MPPGEKNQLLLTASGRRDLHPARLDARDERRVARIDAERARFAGQHDELRLARVDRGFGADDVDVDGGGGDCCKPATNVVACTKRRWRLRQRRAVR